jgi:hypothetical protein
LIVEIGGDAGVRLGSTVTRRTSDNLKLRYCNPTDTRVTVVEAAGFQAHDRQFAGVKPLHPVVMAQQISNRATASEAGRDKREELDGASALKDKADLVPPRVFRLAGQAFRPLTWIQVTKRVAGRHDEAVVKQACTRSGGTSSSGWNLIQPISV